MHAVCASSVLMQTFLCQSFVCGRAVSDAEARAAGRAVKQLGSMRFVCELFSFHFTCLTCFTCDDSERFGGAYAVSDAGARAAAKAVKHLGGMRMCEQGAEGNVTHLVLGSGRRTLKVSAP